MYTNSYKTILKCTNTHIFIHFLYMYTAFAQTSYNKNNKHHTVFFNPQTIYKTYTQKSTKIYRTYTNHIQTHTESVQKTYKNIQNIHIQKNTENIQKIYGKHTRMYRKSTKHQQTSYKNL